MGRRWIALLGVLALAAGLMFFRLSRDAKTALAQLTCEAIDMGRVSDGVYRGEADAGLVYAEVEVRVRNHAIENVQILEHRHGRGGAAEAIADAMVEQNRCDVDAVGGATLSSQTIKSAVSLALKRGQR